MNRDTHGLRAGSGLATDEDIYTALWATAPFPRLPRDAPEELKKYTVDLDDPKRVYTIHRAARRHHFQILVERYIFQIRYGCTSNNCHTPTCFSARRAAARGAPVRRYNATSARTLAVYMATQDNPEQGLCHHPSADRPVPKISPDPETTSNSTGEHPGNDRPREHAPKKMTNRTTIDKSHPLGSHKTESNSKSIESGKEGAQQPILTNPEELDEPAKIDHRSFVQNVFGTSAFKMLEWLTPRSLEILTRPAEIVETSEKGSGSLPQGENLQLNGPKRSSSGVPNKDHCDKKKDAPKSSNTNKNLPGLKPSAINGTAVPASADVLSPTSPRTPQLPIPSHRRKSDFTDSQSPKGILNFPSRTNDPPVDMTLPQFRPSQRRQKLPFQSSLKSPKMQVAEITTITGGKQTSVKIITEPKRPSSRNLADGETKEPATPATRTEERTAPKSRPVDSPMVKKPAPPQSLSSLSIDFINFLSDIMQTDGSAEDHDLKPTRLERDMVKWQNVSLKQELRRRSVSKLISPAANKERWRTFIEQSFFDVLSNSDSILRTFRNSQGRLFDTPTLWYMLLRITRVVPSLLFHSLWVAAEKLFEPPETLQTIHDWARSSPDGRTKPLSNQDAAEIISICLHSLIAAAPLVSEARQLANMSRIRSYGLTMFGRERASLESADLCLQYEDAFTNDPALRLARRLFSSIITRQRFDLLMDTQNGTQTDKVRKPNIFEAILSKLGFLDPDAPALSFTADERNLHEKRVPILLLDWARTVMLQDWEGTAEIPAEGAFGGALALFHTIYENRKPLLLGDIHFLTEYFAERLDPVEMPIAWLSFEPKSSTDHLLNHPYLFNPSTLVTYFRSINYSRMNQAYELASATSVLIRSIDPHMRLMPDQSAQYRLRDRLQVGTSCFMVLEISRKRVLEDTFNAVWRREEREIMRPLKIRLGEEGGEEGMDSGGVQQEFFRLAIAEALDPDYGTFTIDSRTKMTWFQPGSPEPLWKFELIGLIMSLAVYNGLTLPVTFPKALYQKLLNEEVTELHHIADGWPDLANGLTTLLEWDEKDGLVEDIFARTYEFSVSQFGQPVSIEMGSSIATASWPQFSDSSSNANPIDAPMVTNENRNSYVSDYIRFLTDVSIQPQFDAFKKGFLTCLHPRSLWLFTPSTLQSVVEGTQEIDIAELRRVTRYIGWDSSHRTVRDFWSIVKRYSLDEKRKLLEFVTASDRVPVGGIRNVQFTLQRNGVDDGHLPSSYTCYGILLCPEYSTKEVLREKLAMALQNSKGFGFA